jgi:hypothetical protein
MEDETVAQSKGRKRVSFTADEDDRLRKLVARFGESDWGRVANGFAGRDRRQCRDRWFKYLAPTVHNGPWSAAEEDLLRRKVDELGRRWTSIQSAFPGRTDINIRNHWKQMKKMGLAYRQRAAPPVATSEVKETLNDFIDALMLNGEYPDPSGNFGFCMLW